MSQEIIEKLQALGIDPVVPLNMCAQALGVSPQTLKNKARRGELEIVRVSERRCGIRRSMFDKLDKSLKSAVTVTGKNTRRRLGAMAKLKPEIAEPEIANDAV